MSRAPVATAAAAADGVHQRPCVDWRAHREADAFEPHRASSPIDYGGAAGGRWMVGMAQTSATVPSNRFALLRRYREATVGHRHRARAYQLTHVRDASPPVKSHTFSRVPSSTVTSELEYWYIWVLQSIRPVSLVYPSYYYRSVVLGQTERLPAWVFCGFWGLILVDSTRNWFYDFASSAGEMELPKTAAAGAIDFGHQRMAVISTDTTESACSTFDATYVTQRSSITGRAIPALSRSRLKSLCLGEMMPARW